MSPTAPVRLVDLVVVGDGPAGSALAAACTRRGIEVVLVGPGDDWTHTYGVWVDDLDAAELPDGPAPVLAAALESPAVHADERVQIDRTYGVIDNVALRATLRAGVEHLAGRVTAVESSSDGTARHRVTWCAEDGTAAELRARIVIDTAGWPSSFAKRSGTKPPAWQTAMGVVLPEPPDGDLGVPTWMDFRPVLADRDAGEGSRRSTIGPIGVSTFCYCLPVADGWLVEETVLAARPAVEPVALLPRLAGRLGRHPDDLLADAVRTEYVRIPMGGSRPDPGQPVVAFGAAAGYVHPATGFSVSASLRAAPRVADAVGEALAATRSTAAGDAAVVSDAVWSPAMRRTRVLHDYGLEILLRLDEDEIRAFFGRFFDLPYEDWTAYLRIDTPPGQVAGVMTRLFGSSSWSMRRRLMSGNPTAFARLLRP
jgi:lycopene beta-cyclase